MQRTRLVILVLLLALACRSASAQIAFDAASASDTAGTPSTTLTFSHTVTGSNPVLSLCAAVFTASDVLTSIAYNSVNATLMQKSQFNTDRWLYQYVLTSPATGAHNVVVTLSSSSNMAAAVESLTGANGTQPDNSNIGTTTSATSRTSSLTPSADNTWISECGSAVGVPVGASTGITQRAITGDLGNGSSFYRLLIGDSNAAIHPAASTSMTITAGSTSDLASSMASFTPAAASAVKCGALRLLGVGCDEH